MQFQNLPQKHEDGDHRRGEARRARADDADLLAGAGLDVWEQEPPPKDHPLLSHPAVICTQHTAGVTHESRAMITRIAAEAIRKDMEAYVGCVAGALDADDYRAKLAERFGGQ